MQSKRHKNQDRSNIETCKHIQHTQTSTCRHARPQNYMQENTHAHTSYDSFVSTQRDTNSTDYKQEHIDQVSVHCVCIRAPHQQLWHKKNKQCLLLLLLRPALLLTEDNHLRAASPCCLPLCVSACLRLSKCTQRATVDHWQHHPRPVLQPPVTDECPHTVWLSDQSVWVTKTGPRAESASVNRHFL